MGEHLKADAMHAPSPDRGLWGGTAHVGVTQSGCTHVEEEGKQSEASESFRDPMSEEDAQVRGHQM
jgi:hypothetical protein